MPRFDMSLNTPFLTGFPHLLSGRSKTKDIAILAKKRSELIERGLDAQQQFCDEIDPEIIERHGSTKRLRHYPDAVMFWAFFQQVVSDDSSCAEAVARVQARASSKNLPVPAGGTSSYCEARANLPEEMLKAVNRSLCQQLEANVPLENRWRGLRPKAVDGTSAQMPDTDANRTVYPYPSGQEEGCGFPMVRLVGLIDLSHGGISDFSQSDMQTSEVQGYKNLADEYLSEGDVAIGDRLYSGFALIAGLQEKGVHFIGRAHPARKIDFRKGRKVGPNERIVTWKKPRRKPANASEKEWSEVPGELTLRIIRCKGPDRVGKQTVRYLCTTLLKSESHPHDEVASLYYHRWEIEVRFRDIKTTLGMDMLRTRTPEMIRKEILMHMIAYNLLKLVMLKAGMKHGVNHRRLSFRGVQQVINATRTDFRRADGHPVIRQRLVENMLERIAERLVTERPGRNEPRRVKRRPKCTRWLQKPRHEYFEHFRSDHPPLKILDDAA